MLDCVRESEGKMTEFKYTKSIVVAHLKAAQFGVFVQDKTSLTSLLEGMKGHIKGCRDLDCPLRSTLREIAVGVVGFHDTMINSVKHMIDEMHEYLMIEFEAAGEHPKLAEDDDDCNMVLYVRFSRETKMIVNFNWNYSQMEQEPYSNFSNIIVGYMTCPVVPITKGELLSALIEEINQLEDEEINKDKYFHLSINKAEQPYNEDAGLDEHFENRTDLSDGSEEY